ncbi:unnamed protein product [Ectocarpus sp. 12 AP-2014]
MSVVQVQGWDRPGGFVYEPIDANTGGCSRRRRPRNVLVACALFCAVALGMATVKMSSPLDQSTVQGLANPTTLAAGDGGARSPKQQEPQYQPGMSLSLSTMNRGLLGVRVSNHYQHVNTTHGTTDLSTYPWEHVAEPYQATRLELTSVPEGVRGGSHIKWTIEGETVAEGEDKFFFNTAVAFTTPGKYKCVVTVQNPSTISTAAARTSVPERETTVAAGGHGGVAISDSITSYSAVAATTSTAGEIFEYEFAVTVKYVRREIRALTDRDRETFFNAVSVLQRVPSAVGRAVYGDKYYSKDYFNRMHLYYGGARDCDHWHAGAGFVTSHIAITLMYEQALQAVNPSIALPYWDVTIEGTYYDWNDFRTSSVFSDDWFGDASPGNTARTLTQGRFAYVPVMADAREYSAQYNSYGLLRSAWNNDRNPFLTRHDHQLGMMNNKKPSGCRRYRDAYVAEDWMELTEAFNGGAHGNIHGLLGGTWSPEADEYAAVTPYIVIPFVHHAYIAQKIMWRENAIECPESCTFDQGWKDCQCKCSESLMGGRSAAEFLELGDVISTGYFYDADYQLVRKLADSDGHYYEEIPGYSAEESTAIYEGLKDALCIPTKVGSHFEATSTNDVTFWVLHPTFDRLWHLSRLEQNPVFNETWISDSTCVGHNADDVQPFHDLFLEEHEGEPDVIGSAGGESVGPLKGYYTNAELYDLLHPAGMQLPYVYDNFAWPHCDAQGVYIN